MYRPSIFRRESARPQRSWVGDSSSANGTDEIERADFGVLFVLADLATVADFDLVEAVVTQDDGHPEQRDRRGNTADDPSDCCARCGRRHRRHGWRNRV